MALSATLIPSNQMLPTGSDSYAQNEVFSYFVSSAVSVSKGDFIKLASSTSNTITKCNSSSDAFIGVAVTDLDNSSGTVASATTVGVLRRGIAEVDILVASSSGTQKATVFHDSLLFLANTETDQDVRGQAMTATDNGTGYAKSLDFIPIPSATQIFKGRIYINSLGKEAFD